MWVLCMCTKSRCPLPYRGLQACARFDSISWSSFCLWRERLKSRRMLNIINSLSGVLVSTPDKRGLSGLETLFHTQIKTMTARPTSNHYQILSVLCYRFIFSQPISSRGLPEPQVSVWVQFLLWKLRHVLPGADLPRKLPGTRRDDSHQQTSITKSRTRKTKRKQSHKLEQSKKTMCSSSGGSRLCLASYITSAGSCYSWISD